MSKTWKSAKLNPTPTQITPSNASKKDSVPKLNLQNPSSSSSARSTNSARSSLTDELKTERLEDLTPTTHIENTSEEKSNEIYFTFTNNPDEAAEVIGVLHPDSDDVQNLTENKFECRLIAVRIVDYLNLTENAGYRADYVKTLEPDTSTNPPTKQDLINFNCSHLRWISDWAKTPMTQNNKVTIHIKNFVDFVLEFWFRQEAKGLTWEHYDILYSWLHVFGSDFKPPSKSNSLKTYTKNIPNKTVSTETLSNTINGICFAIALNLLAKPRLNTCSVIPGQVDNPTHQALTIFTSSNDKAKYSNYEEYLLATTDIKSAINNDKTSLLHILASYASVEKNPQKNPKKTPIPAWTEDTARKGGGPIQYEVVLTDNAADSIKANKAIRIDGNPGEASFQVEDLYLVAIGGTEVHFVSSINHYEAKKPADDDTLQTFDEQLEDLAAEIKEDPPFKARQEAEERGKQERANIDKARKAAQEYLNFDQTPVDMDDTEDSWWRFARNVFEKIVFNKTDKIDLNVLIDGDESVISLFNKAYSVTFERKTITKYTQYQKYFVSPGTGSQFFGLVIPIIINAIKVLFGKKNYRFNKTGNYENTAAHRGSVDNTIATALLSSVETPESTRQIFLNERLDLFVVLQELNKVFMSFKQKQRDQNKPKGGMSFGGTIRKRRGLLSKTIRRERK